MRYILVACIFCMLCLGCKTSPVETMTAGHARVGACDAVFDLSWKLSQEFQTVNKGAFIDIVRGTNREWVDSLLNKKSEQVILDRGLTSAESSAFKQQNLTLLTYPVAFYPIYLLVDSGNTVRALDSLTLRDILTGRITNWKSVGGQNLGLTVYLPPPGEGAWNSLQRYFEVLDSVSAVICMTSGAMLDSAKGDRGALMVYAQPFDQLPYRKLRFALPSGDVSANVKQIVEEPLYPFRLDITYVTTRSKGDVAAGFLTHCVSNLGQKRVMNLGYRPASVPVRIIKMSGGS